MKSFMAYLIYFKIETVNKTPYIYAFKNVSLRSVGYTADVSFDWFCIFTIKDCLQRPPIIFRNLKSMF